MCEICRQHPCHPRCPNAPDPVIVTYCACCGEPIREGYEYYEVEGKDYCEDCADHTWFSDDDAGSTTCENCRETIDFDDECYEINGKYYCPECVDKKIAEEDFYL